MLIFWISVAEMSGKKLPFEKSDKDPMLEIGSEFSNSTMTNSGSLGHKSSSDSTSRRRSILPSWSNLRKDRSKSKDRDPSIESSANGQISHSSGQRSKMKKTKALLGDQYHSMTSLTSNTLENAKEEPFDTTNESDEAMSTSTGNNCALARVILPDKATTVVQTRQGS